MIMTSAKGDGLGLLRRKPANCRSLSSKGVRVEIKCFPPTEAGFIGKRSVGKKTAGRAQQAARAGDGWASGEVGGSTVLRFWGRREWGAGVSSSESLGRGGDGGVEATGGFSHRAPGKRSFPCMKRRSCLGLPGIHAPFLW